MNNKILSIIAISSVAAMSICATQMNKQNPMVGGQAMSKSMNIVQNALNSADHTTLVAAVKAAGLVDTLQSKGPFTVFAPTNDAFRDLPEGTVDSLLKPENKDALTKVLTYHVVAGQYDSKTLRELARKNGGSAMLKTVAGDSIWIEMNGPTNLVIKDDKGGVAHISTYDVYQSNGVIHVIDRVLMP